MLHIVTPTTISQPPHIYGKIAFSSDKIALHTNLLSAKLLQIAYEQLQIAFYLNTLYILIALKNEVAHMPTLFYFQKIKYNNRIKCVCIQASTFFKWFGKLFHATRYFPLLNPCDTLEYERNPVTSTHPYPRWYENILLSLNVPSDCGITALTTFPLRIRN